MKFKNFVFFLFAFIMLSQISYSQNSTCHNAPAGPYYVRTKVWVAWDNNLNGPTATEVNALLDLCQSTFNQKNIYLNFCVEYIVNEQLINDPNLFLDTHNFGSCVVYDDPNAIDVLLISDHPKSAGTAEFGGQKCWSEANQSMIHELGHVFSLYHPHNESEIFNCAGNIPNYPNWLPGDLLSNPETGDLVDDTPLMPIDVDGDARIPIYDYDAGTCTINWGNTDSHESCSAPPNNLGGNFPSNYDHLDDGTGQLVYNATLENNIMFILTEAACPPEKSFTDGQGCRMRDHIANNKTQFLDSGAESCEPTGPPSQPCTILSGIINTSMTLDDPCYLISGDIEITDGAEVHFLNTDVNFINLPGDLSDIIITNGGSLIIDHSTVGESQCDLWGGIVSTQGGGYLGILDSHISNSKGISSYENESILFSASNNIDIARSKFHNLEGGIFIERTSSDNTFPDNLFINTDVKSKAFSLEFQGCKFYNSDITVTVGTLMFWPSENHLCALYNSGISFNGIELWIDDTYVENNGQFVNVEYADKVVVCRSLFDSKSGANAPIIIEDAETYLVFHNHFTGIVQQHISVVSESTDKSIIQNNIFDGSSGEDLFFLGENYVDIACNFHESANFSWSTVNQLPQQGEPDHPAGNKFANGLGANDIQNLTGPPFLYYYNPNNPMEELPDFAGGNGDPQPSNTLATAGFCLSRSQISDIWGPGGNEIGCQPDPNIPIAWYNWPNDCGDPMCIECDMLQDDIVPVSDSERGSGRNWNPNENEVVSIIKDRQMMSNEIELLNLSTDLIKNDLKILVTPNPVHNTLRFTFENHHNDLTADIFNYSGQRVSTIQKIKETHSEDVSGFLSGIYIILIKNKFGEIIFSEKFIKI